MDAEIISFLNLKGFFSDFIDDETNRQILFSGPFGSGKTTFIRDFFGESADYEVFNIFPVNYSLHNNADIYEILKYDLILELITKGAFQKEDISDLSKYVFATSESADRIFATMLGLFSSTGKKLTEVVDLLKSTKFKDNIKSISNPILGVEKFGEIIDKVKGYSYDDYVTSVIKSKVAELSPDKKKVMVVDDLDRVDPDHLFRIISVFSAHIDQSTEENKFGFDKIIFVGDVQNFRGLYKHKFGIANNFTAFISKLSSKKPFEFNPRRELYIKIPELLNQFKFVTVNKDYTFYPMIEFNRERRDWVTYVICTLIENGIISLRDLQKNKQTPIEFVDKIIPTLFIEQRTSEVYFLLSILNQLLSELDKNRLLEQEIQYPLSIQSIYGSGEINAGYVIAILSQIPLSIIKHDEIKSLRGVESNKQFENELSISGHVMSVEFARHQITDRLVCQLQSQHATETNLIALSFYSIKVLEGLIKKSNYS